MKNKYNLALIPTIKSQEFIDVAGKFARVSDKYCLGKNSIPHITLYKFETEESAITSIWKKICDSQNFKSIDLELSKFSYITFDKNTYWVSLLPENSKKLYEIHSLMADILRLPVKKTYDPHLTLINTKKDRLQDDIEKIERSWISIKDTFQLSLGKSDEIGQFTDIIVTLQLK